MIEGPKAKISKVHHPHRERECKRRWCNQLHIYLLDLQILRKISLHFLLLTIAIGIDVVNFHVYVFDTIK